MSTDIELIEAAVQSMTPMVTNETHAWNLWNHLNTSDAFEAAFLRFHPRPNERTVECPHWAPGRVMLRNGCTACTAESLHDARG